MQCICQDAINKVFVFALFIDRGVKRGDVYFTSAFQQLGDCAIQCFEGNAIKDVKAYSEHRGQKSAVTGVQGGT